MTCDSCQKKLYEFCYLLPCDLWTSYLAMILFLKEYMAACFGNGKNGMQGSLLECLELQIWSLIKSNVSFVISLI